MHPEFWKHVLPEDDQRTREQLLSDLQYLKGYAEQAHMFLAGGLQSRDWHKLKFNAGLARAELAVGLRYERPPEPVRRKR